MQAHQWSWTEASGWRGVNRSDPNLVLFFGARLRGTGGTCGGARYRDLRAMFPQAHTLGCSTGGRLSTTARRMRRLLRRHCASTRRGGLRILARLRRGHRPRPDGEGARRLFVLFDGRNLNGGELVAVGAHVPITGGLAGDGAKFEETLVSADCEPCKQTVAAVGF